MLALKIPIGALLWIVWWAIHQNEPEPGTGNGDGGTKVRPPRHPPRPRRWPRHRGPHGEPVPPAPARVRTTIAKGRELHRP